MPINNVFRLFQDKALQHWNSRGGAYGAKEINNIQSADGNITTIEPTSIPSPFARLDLAKAAFEYVANNGNLNGNTVYHKIVSDCLDVGQIFFNFSQLGNKVHIISWDKANDLNNLKNSPFPGQKLLGDTIDLFMKQDGGTYNFGQMHYLYFLLYNQKVIGGTSPASLFFTSANNLSFVDIQFGNVKVFDATYEPLYMRDPKYQEYLHFIFHSNPILKNNIREVDAYLAANLSQLQTFNPQLYNNISQTLLNVPSVQLQQQLQNKYDLIQPNGPGNNVSVLQVPLSQLKPANVQKTIMQNSGFVISSQKFNSGLLPLVLPVGSFKKQIIYTINNWDTNTQVPFADNTPINQRTLPSQQTQYPYLTISDFLEPYLIRVPYELNKDSFFDGNFDKVPVNDNAGYILPIKKLFFDYFNLADLKSSIGNNPMIEIKSFAGGKVKVILRIPIRNNDFIEYERIYSGDPNSQTTGPDETQNKGVIIDLKLGMSIYPFFKTGTDNLADYRVSLALDYDKSWLPPCEKHELLFFKEDGMQANVQGKTIRNRENNGLIGASIFSVTGKEFDYIIFNADNKYKGILVPLFPMVTQGIKGFTYAIDFGTTNTHIEYKVNGTENPQSFELVKNKQIVTLYKRGSQALGVIEALVLKMQIPDQVGNGSEFSFPQRTSLSHDNNFTGNIKAQALAEMNIPFYYAKETEPGNTLITTDLKWSNFVNNPLNSEMVRCSFEELLMLIRNHVLVNGGNLNATNLTCFYPSSMSLNKRNQMAIFWDNLFKQYITGNNSPKHISESVAPFFWIIKKERITAGNRPAITIDIGGGTSDSVIYENNEPRILTSFRFAADSIFGDGLNSNIDKNGFILKYKPEVIKLLSGTNLKTVLDEIFKTGNSKDVISFFFSLESNRIVKEKNINISFSDYLKNEEKFKPVFLIFYGAIIYHLASVMQRNGMKAPAHVIFSGNGSKIINILDPNPAQSGITGEFTRLMFEKVYGSPCDKVSLFQPLSPKELTCKGGLLADEGNPLQIESIKQVIYGGKQGIDDSALTYSKIDEAIKENVVNNVLSFGEILFRLDQEYNYHDKMGIEPTFLNSAKEILTDKLKIKDYLFTGIEKKKHELGGNLDVKLDETLFFYPFIGLLNEVAFEVANIN